MILEWFVGFYRAAPYDEHGKINWRTWFGHVEIWGYTVDDTWVFYDPQSRGGRMIITHHHEDVLDQLTARNELCDLILKLPGERQKDLFPIYPPMTCASIVGHLLGVRAFTPYGLKTKLLANGAEVTHEVAKRRSSRKSSAGA